jgi:hypothetical protein
MRTIVLVLRSGGDFSINDVILITTHIINKWKDSVKPNIICLWDNASEEYDLGNIKFIPLKNNLPGTWSRIQLYSPEMEKYRPFLYVDLDTAIIDSLENIFDLIKNENHFITLEDFYQKGTLATGLVWFPSNSEKISKVWKNWKGIVTGRRMDYFLRKHIKPDTFWQNLTNFIFDFKPNKKVLTQLPIDAKLVCLHGKPRIFEAATYIEWVNKYVHEYDNIDKPKVSVIISYKEDRGWLQEAINSVPKWCQLIVTQGNEGWSKGFNEGLEQATGDYIKYLHEDDMLSENCILDSVKAIEDQKVDFIHGNVIELVMKTGNKNIWVTKNEFPKLQDMIKKNTMHSASMM